MANRDNFKTFYALSLAWQLGFLIAVPLAGFMIAGFWLDKKINSGPFMLLAGMIVGVVITVYEVYHLLAPLISDKEKHG